MFKYPLSQLLILEGGAFNSLFEWYTVPRLLSLLALV
jgi:hypothetical protein